MRLELERIPVYDGLRSGSECFICDLMAEAETDAIAFHLGNSVMNPETRVRVNEHGFCPSHWHALVEANRPQGVALMGDTYLATTRQKLAATEKALRATKGKRQTKKAVKALKELLASRDAGCLVCTQMQKRLERYLETTAYLWEQEEAFRKELLVSKGFCLHHYTALLVVAERVVKEYDHFVREITEIEMKHLERIGEEIYWMTQMFKSENHGKEWNGCEDAHRRTVDKMVGRHRVIDPL
ncbi:MAG TPA: DUF6062 family protein [Sphaerochaeta sp.]|nr:DUF6062 family protein [Sphaerochaeta sp.]